MKTAKLEMKGIRCLEWANVTGLCYPLFAVIQLNGYSLIAQSLVFFHNSSIEIEFEEAELRMAYKIPSVASDFQRDIVLWKR